MPGKDLPDSVVFLRGELNQPHGREEREGDGCLHGVSWEGRFVPERT